MSSEKDALARAHAFIAEVEAVVTDAPEFAGVRIAGLFEKHGQQIAEDRAVVARPD